MGINTLNTNTALQQKVAYSSSAVTANDLIYVTDNGKSFIPNSKLPIANSTATTNGMSSVHNTVRYNVNAYTGGPSSSSTRTAKNIIELSNGNFAYGYSGDASGSQTTDVKVDITTPTGAVIRTLTISDSGITSVKMQRINASNFAVVWNNGSNIYFAVYTNDGTTVLGATSVSSVSGTGGNCFNVEALNSGDFIIAFNAGTDCSFMRYDSSGTQQGSSVTVEASANPIYIQILRQSGGGFIVVYYRQTSTAAYKFARYNATGTLQGTLTTIASTSNVFNAYNAYDQTAVELSNGNIVFVTTASATQYSYYSVYSSTGTQIVAPTLIEPNSSNISFYTLSRPGLCATDTGFTILIPYSQALYVYAYDTSGNKTISSVLNSSITTNYVNNGNNSVFLYSNGFNYCVFLTSADNNNYAGVNLISFTNTSVIGTQIVAATQSSTNQAASNAFAFVTTDFNLVYKMNYALQVYLGSYNICRKSAYGVAQESVSANTLFKVNTAGTYILNSTYATGAVVNDRTNTVVGTRGSIFGNVANLDGLV
jgi:hypothetical protein